MRYRRLMRFCESCGGRYPLDELGMVEWQHPSLRFGVFLKLCRTCMQSFLDYRDSQRELQQAADSVWVHSP